jgi:hypothetical protein
MHSKFILDSLSHLTFSYLLGNFIFNAFKVYFGFPESFDLFFLAECRQKLENFIFNQINQHASSAATTLDYISWGFKFSFQAEHENSILDSDLESARIL